MTLNELYAVNGDWKYNPDIIFEFHYPRDEHANNLNPYCKINWNQVSENAKNSNVLYFETISKSRVWIELDIQQQGDWTKSLVPVLLCRE